MDFFTFYIPGEISFDKLVKQLDPGYSLNFTELFQEPLRADLLDNFTHQLFDGGKLLLQTHEQLLLLDVKSGALVTHNLLKSEKRWKFVEDLEGEITDCLAECSNLRSFSSIAELSIVGQTVALLDDEEKTRVRIKLFVLEANGQKISVGVLSSLRGYEDDAYTLRSRLLLQGVQPCTSCVALYKSLGLPTPSYVAKPTVNLDPQAPARESASKIISVHIDVARQNEAGVIDDLDTEYLHDYRVSLRKVRSVLSLFKGVYSEKDTERMKLAVADVMKSTNRLRDLDVFLLERDVYAAMVPPTFQPALERVFSQVADERKQAMTDVVKVLKSKSYKQKIGRIAAQFTDKSTLKSGPNAQESSLEMACSLILKRFFKVCKTAQRIDADTPDEEVHRLRIHCKKLRYLMEFFAPLFSTGDIKTLIKALKRLQDRLGDFNDYSVQQEFIRNLLPKGKNLKGGDVGVVEAIGVLGGVLHMKQRAERERIMSAFASFDSRQNHNAFVNLFRFEDT